MASFPACGVFFEIYPMKKNYTAHRHLPLAWERLHHDTRLLARHLIERGPWKGIVSVARGGLIPASIIARELDIRLVDCLSIISYDDRVQGEARVIKSVHTDLVQDGTGWIIVDDLVDSGKTARLVKKLLPNSHMATVYAKPEGMAFVDTYAVSMDQDVWLLFPWEAELMPNEPLARHPSVQAEETVPPSQPVC